MEKRSQKLFGYKKIKNLSLGKLIRFFYKENLFNNIVKRGFKLFLIQNINY